MIESIGALNPMLGSNGVKGVEGLASTGPAAKTGGTGFADVISDVLKEASQASAKADNLNNRLQAGDPNVTLEQTVIAMNVSSLQFTGIVQARNRVMQAYSEIMNMPV